MPANNTNEIVSIFEILYAVRRAPTFFVTIFLICLVSIASVYLILPRQYYSEGKFFVQVGRSSVGNDTTTTSGTISIQDTRETEVKSVVEILRSRQLAERVADKIGVERILEPHSKIGRYLETLPRISLGVNDSDETIQGLTAEEYATLRRREEAVNDLMGKLSLDHQKKTTVISVAIKSQTPFLAQEIVDTYLDEYQIKHIEINSQHAGAFFDDEFEKQNEALKIAECALQSFRDKHKSLSIDGARSLQQDELGKLKLNRVDTIMELSQANERAVQLAEQLADIPKLIDGADTKVSSLAADKGREALFQLQIEESEAVARYGPDNPKLMIIRDKVKSAQKELESLPASFMQEASDVSTANQELLVLLSDARASAAALAKRLIQTDDLILFAEERATVLNEATIRGGELDRDVQIHQRALMKIAGKRSDANTIGALDSQRISNVAIAQPASLILKKAFPSGLMFAVMGTAISFFVAFSLTFFKEANIVLGSRVAANDNFPSPQTAVESGVPAVANLAEAIDPPDAFQIHDAGHATAHHGTFAPTNSK